MSSQSVIPGDAEIRPALRSTLQAKHANEPNTVFVEELGVCRGQARVDIAVVNGFLHGYEIKSDRDSLRRLDGQIEFYGKVLDRATLVVGGRHLTEVMELVPEWWGVLRINSIGKQVSFRTVRRVRTNPLKDPRALVELLWLDDAMALLAERDATRGVRGRPRRVVWDRVCEYFNVDEIGVAVRDRLKARAATRSPPRPL